MNQFPAKNLLLLFLTAVIWGTAFVAQSVGMDHIGPFTFNAIRSLVGGLALIPAILIFGRMKSEERRREERAQRKTLLLGGVFCGLALGIASCLQQVGIQYTTVGKAGFITALYIVIVPILGLFFRKKVGPKLWVSVVIAILGLYLLCMSGSLQLQKGDFLVLLCAFCFSVHIMVIDYFTTKVDGVQMSCIQFFVAALFSGLCMLGIEGIPDPHAVAISWAPILYAGVLSSGVGYTLQIIGQKGLNPTVASLILSLESVISVLAGWLFLGQNMSAREVMGCVLMFGAIVLAQLPDRKKTRPEEAKAGKTALLIIQLEGLFLHIKREFLFHNAGKTVHLELGAGETAGNGRSHFSGNSVPLIPGVKAGNLSHQPEFPGAQLLGVVLCRSEQLTSQATTLQVRNYRQVSQNEVPCTVLEGGCGYKFSSF